VKRDATPLILLQGTEKVLGKATEYHHITLAKSIADFCEGNMVI
jgi:hypothetical protein